MKHKLVNSILTIFIICSVCIAQDKQGQLSRYPEHFKSDFNTLCDLAVAQLNNEIRKDYDKTRIIPFYQDSYIVRALCVAYDMTGNSDYLKTCQIWTDRMLNYQAHMIPEGGYYMNYGRQPSVSKKEKHWFVADCSSIGMAVLAVAIRSNDKDKQRYLESADKFGELVLNNFVGPNGGVTDGFWTAFDGEWWCSSGIFGSFAILMRKETGQEKYKKAALDIIDWLNPQDFMAVEPYNIELQGPSLAMYWYEAYSASLPYIEKGTKRYDLAMAQIEKGLDWMVENQGSRGHQPKWGYYDQWGSKFGGLPFHMYIWSNYFPEDEHDMLINDADKELEYISKIIFAENNPSLSQLVSFAMISYAERLMPGKMYR